MSKTYCEVLVTPCLFSFSSEELRPPPRVDINLGINTVKVRIYRSRQGGVD